MTRKIVTVIWGDAHVTQEERTLNEIIGDHKPTLIHTMGYIVHEDEGGVSIVAEHLPPEKGGDETFRGVTYIPRPWIVKTKTARKKKIAPPPETPVA